MAFSVFCPKIFSTEVPQIHYVCCSISAYEPLGANAFVLLICDPAKTVTIWSPSGVMLVTTFAHEAIPVVQPRVVIGLPEPQLQPC
jgi:hypothetical protein